MSTVAKQQFHNLWIGASFSVLQLENLVFLLDLNIHCEPPGIELNQLQPSVTDRQDLPSKT